MQAKRLILGITGNIAAGKSLVARFFADKGATLVSADQLAREAVSPGSTALRQLVDCFGEQILLADGGLDRKRLAKMVFADSAAREKLNRITHPAIAALAERRLQQLRKQPGGPLVVYEAPLLFEAGAEGRVDQILVVRIDPQVQLQRLMHRDGLTEAEARQRIAAQLGQDEKVARADFVIDNSGNPEATREQVERLWAQLVTDEDR